MDKQIIITASVFGMLAVIAGAFGAHALKAVLAAEQLQTWQTAVQYQFYHVFALLFLAVLAQQNGSYTNAAFYLFTFGIIFFSGSLYLLSCRHTLGWDWLKFMGPITPIGGLLFIGGWFMLLLAALKQK
jgi:uncharacterized membrane protein YgdD (TMEM256/DUF423 family)